MLVDLGAAPPSNAYLTGLALRRPEKYFPLRVLVCESCWLVQAEAYSRAAELFNEEYAYFSSFSTEWLDHAKRYVEDMSTRFNLSRSSTIVEIAANDGYLLHAAGLHLRLPGDENGRNFSAPLPEHFEVVLKMLRKYGGS